MPGIVAARYVKAQRVMIPEICHAIATIKPGCQLNAAVKLHLITQLCFGALQHVKGLEATHRGISSDKQSTSGQRVKMRKILQTLHNPRQDQGALRAQTRRFAVENLVMNLFLYLSVVLIWGTTWIAIYAQQSAGISAVTVAVFWRFLLASLVMLLLLKLIKRLHRLTLQDHLFCVLQGCCVFGFNFVCFYYASGYISSGLESVIFSMAVMYSAINSWIFFRQRPSARLIPAIVLGMAGIVALFWHDLRSTQPRPA